MLIFAHRKIDRGSLKISEVPHMFILYSVFATTYNGQVNCEANQVECESNLFFNDTHKEKL